MAASFLCPLPRQLSERVGPVLSVEVAAGRYDVFEPCRRIVGSNRVFGAIRQLSPCDRARASRPRPRYGRALLRTAPGTRASVRPPRSGAPSATPTSTTAWSYLVFTTMPGSIRWPAFPNQAAARPVSEEVLGSAQEKPISLRVIFDTCEPRDEVLRGDLRDEMFAARGHTAGVL